MVNTLPNTLEHMNAIAAQLRELKDGCQWSQADFAIVKIEAEMRALIDYFALCNEAAKREAITGEWVEISVDDQLEELHELNGDGSGNYGDMMYCAMLDKLRNRNTVYEILKHGELMHVEQKYGL